MARRGGLLTFAALLFGGATPALASDWYQTGEAVGGTSVMFVDRDSIRTPSEGYRRAQVYLVYSTNQDDGTASVDSLMEFDCTAPRSRFLQLVIFDDRLRRIDSIEGSGRWSPVPPRSQQDATLAFVCSAGSSSSSSFGATYPFAAGRAIMARAAQ